MTELIPSEVYQLGALAIIFFLFVKEFFSYLKGRKNGTGINQAILDQLQTQNSNHLHTITEEITKGFDKLECSVSRLNDTTRNGQEKMIGILSEIKGQLSK